MENQGDYTVRYPIPNTDPEVDSAQDLIAELDVLCNTFVNTVNASRPINKNAQLKQYVLKIIQHVLGSAANTQCALPPPVQPPFTTTARSRSKGSKLPPIPPSTAHVSASNLATTTARTNCPHTRIDKAIFPEARLPPMAKAP